MKKVSILILMVAVVLSSCTNSGEGYLIGVQGRGDFFQPDPFGMLFIPMGSYTMGPSDQDVPYSQTAQSKTVSIQAFYMDETEITNNEYRQFVHYVRDSIVHTILSNDDEEHLITQNDYEEDYDPPFINWRHRIRWDEPEVRQALEEEIYLPQHERFYRYREIDSRKLNYEYYWIDLKEAAKKDFSKDKRKPDAASLSNRPVGLSDRSVYIRKDVINVYPDTLSWVHDFTYSFNEPMTENYFWHPSYDNYPVVGVNWKQATAFCIWRTQLLHDFMHSIGEPFVHRFRLPTESEWEWAARGGLDLNPYPWGGPYIRNSNGCFNGNYKPLRGNYVDDGGFHTIIVAHWAPNDFGLFDMGGNVAEWTSNAFDESAFNFAHDLNMDYCYDAKDEDPSVLKRKVIRGGSWKDIGYYMQVSSRTYEYQDSCRCFVGFRCVQTYMGRMKGDGAGASNVY
ncbi:MAG: SUMF1/EgtB/PvdO family nonheme iron enzyme [Bacteroidetes bacterium]|nr:SUMF1/EgtB/PvdO family nonheme iron enzyme [Bacteroidota bacterium]